MVRETRNENIDDDTRARAREYVSKNADSPKSEAPKASGSFGSAFAEARKSGAKTFEHNGKKYTTEMASDKPKAAPKTSSYGSENRTSSRTQSEPEAKPDQSPRSSYARGVADTLRKSEEPKSPRPTAPAREPSDKPSLAFGPKKTFGPSDGAKSIYDRPSLLDSASKFAQARREEMDSRPRYNKDTDRSRFNYDNSPVNKKGDRYTK